MALDDALDRGQSDADAREVLLAVQALERLEELLGVAGIEAGTVVGDAEAVAVPIDPDAGLGGAGRNKK